VPVLASLAHGNRRRGAVLFGAAGTVRFPLGL